MSTETVEEKYPRHRRRRRRDISSSRRGTDRDLGEDVVQRRARTSSIRGPEKTER